MLKTVDWNRGSVELIDQTLLPAKLVKIRCRRVDQVREAIQKLRVRGAPAIGVAAALGILLALDPKTRSTEKLVRAVRAAARRLASARPTAVNLSWAAERMVDCAVKNRRQNAGDFRKKIQREAFRIRDEDRRLCEGIAASGTGLLKSGDRVLTHCNAGALATAGIGTALGVVYAANRSGKKLTVTIGETRPLLQGARLTTWELLRRKIGVTLVCDNMVASVMQKKKIDKVIVGADRIAANGDTANKIGTYSIACLAHLHGIPFYVAAPSSTFDFSIPSGDGIPIEERAAEEIKRPFGYPAAPQGVRVFNPAFDVTPARLITGIITERGVARPPYRRSLKKLLRGAKSVGRRTKR